jgi:NAD+ diphosphatase
MFTYCPKCASTLEKTSQNLLTCSKCGFHYYINPKPTNALIAENERGQIMLVRRGIEPQKGMWDLPGGFIEPGETLEESMQREAKEELGVGVEDLKYFGSYPDIYEYQDITFPTLVFALTGKLNESDLAPQDDIDKIEFCDKDKIPFEELAFESLKRTLKDYINS